VRILGEDQVVSREARADQGSPAAGAVRVGPRLRRPAHRS
jgi:hypothetical protein